MNFEVKMNADIDSNGIRSYPITNKTLSEWLSENGVTDYSGLLIP